MMPCFSNTKFVIGRELINIFAIFRNTLTSYNQTNILYSLMFYDVFKSVLLKSEVLDPGLSKKDLEKYKTLKISNEGFSWSNLI